jgi:AcrR family transcriptional regulator
MATREHPTPTSRSGPRASGEDRLAARRTREREIVDATRALFDEHGMQDAPITDIARAVGINKALIYRHFSSKEELFVLTVTRYLADLAVRLADIGPELDPVTQLREASERYTAFCLEYPAFLDCSLSLMRRPARELQQRVSEAVWFRLGQAMAECLGLLSRILARGAELGSFDVPDPDFTANHLYTQVLGTMHLARIGVGVREAAPGVPGVFRISAERVRQACIDDAMALVGARPSAPEPA